MGLSAVRIPRELGRFLADSSFLDLQSQQNDSFNSHQPPSKRQKNTGDNESSMDLKPLSKVIQSPQQRVGGDTKRP